MSRLRQLLSLVLGDPIAERVRRNHEEAIRELQDLPMASTSVVKDVSLVDGQVTLVAHGLGRTPQFVGVSVVRGATATGRIVESRSGTANRAEYVVLTATGHGATITVDLVIL